MLSGMSRSSVQVAQKRRSSGSKQLGLTRNDAYLLCPADRRQKRESFKCFPMLVYYENVRKVEDDVDSAAAQEQPQQLANGK